MKRYEVVQEVWEKVLEAHAEAFGWTNSAADHNTGYSLLTRPADFDYEGWKKKVLQLEKVHGFLMYLEDALRKLDKLGAGSAIRVCFEPPTSAGYNVTVRLRNAQLAYKWGCEYRSHAARYVPVETTESLDEYALRERQKKALAELDSWGALDIMKRVIEEELEEARRHVEWLEEEVGEDE